MASEKAQALVLRVVEFSETSAVVTLFTREFGKISALAKGARRPKGAFDSALDLVCRIRIVFLRKSSGTLDLLTEAKLEQRFRWSGRELAPWYAAFYVTELLDGLTDAYDPHPQLFDAAVETLDVLGNPRSVAAGLVHFELATLRVLGHLPTLEHCGECGGDVQLTGRVPFGVESGGVLCPNCRPGKRHVISLTGGAVAAMARFADADGTAWRQIEMDRAQRAEIRGTLNQVWCSLLGKKPRLQAFLSP